MALAFGGQYKYTEMHSGSTSTGNGVALEPLTMEGGNYTILTCQITGVSGDTITFEGTIDELFWFAIKAINQTTLVISTLAQVDGLYRLPVSGLTSVRARISTYSAGYIRVLGLLSVNGEMGFGTGVGGSVTDHAQLSNLDYASAAHTGFASTGTVQAITGVKTMTTPVLLVPVVADFTSATHAHTNAASGGTIAHSVLTGLTTGDPHTQYLLGSAYTAADVLAKLLTVDGAASGLDADLLDGNSSAAFEAAGTSATHAALTAAHGATGAVVGTTNAQTLTSKTLTAPVIATIVNTGTLTLPTSTDTLVGKATTDTLTNKTLTTPTIGDFTNANHTHAGASTGGTIAHTALTSIGTNTHAQIDTHITNTAFTSGTWTPALTFGGAAVGITYSVQVGRYVRMGSVVYAWAFCALSNKGSSTGVARLTSLPVTSKNVANFNQPVTLRLDLVTGMSGGIVGFIGPNLTTIRFEFLGTGTATELDNTHFGNSSSVMVTCIYEV